MFNCIKEVSINLIDIILRSFKEFLFLSNWSLHSILFARKDQSCRAFGKRGKCTYVHTHTCINRDVQTHIFIHTYKHAQSYKLLTWIFFCHFVIQSFLSRFISYPIFFWFFFYLMSICQYVRAGFPQYDSNRLCSYVRTVPFPGQRWHRSVGNTQNTW